MGALCLTPPDVLCGSGGGTSVVDSANVPRHAAPPRPPYERAGPGAKEGLS
jgi:hypothetical protein